MCNEYSKVEMEPGQDFWPVIRPDPRWLLTRWPDRPDPTGSLSVVKQILDNGLIAISVTCQETQTV